MPQNAKTEARCAWCGHGDRLDRGTVAPFEKDDELTPVGYTGFHPGCREAREQMEIRRLHRKRGKFLGTRSQTIHALARGEVVLHIIPNGIDPKDERITLEVLASDLLRLNIDWGRLDIKRLRDVLP